MGLRNTGLENLERGDYRVRIVLPQFLEGGLDQSLLRGDCSDRPDLLPRIVDVPEEDLPASMRRGPIYAISVSVPFRFPQAGAIVLRGEAFMEDDGNPANNVYDRTVNIGLPAAMICEADPATAFQGEETTLRGNWFGRFGGSGVPLVRFGDFEADVLELVCPRSCWSKYPRWGVLSARCQ